MASAKALAGLMVGLAIAATLFLPVFNVVDATAGSQNVTNESVTADVGNWTDLEGYDIENDSETVYWFNNTSGSYEEVTRGTDYEMDYGPGAIKALENGSINDGDDLKVSYTYQATDATTATIINLVPLFLALLMLGTMAAKVSDGL